METRNFYRIYISTMELTRIIHLNTFNAHEQREFSCSNFDVDQLIHILQFSIFFGIIYKYINYYCKLNIFCF